MYIVFTLLHVSIVLFIQETVKIIFFNYVHIFAYKTLKTGE